MSKKFKTFQFTDVWKSVFDEPETHGIWIIFGKDKNGKTWFSLKLAEYFTTFCRVLYISAEEGISLNLKQTVVRAQINVDNPKLLFCGYELMEELKVRLNKRNAPKVVFIDNLTVYVDELKNGELRRLEQEFPNTLFVLIAHEDDNKPGTPYTATGKLAKKLAKAIVHVQGLACFVSGRCTGGTLTIDEEKASLYHGHSIKNPNQ